jgi:hypothetical protein
VASDPETCDLSVDKYAAHCFFEQHGIGSPGSWLPGELPAELPFRCSSRRNTASRPHINRADADSSRSSCASRRPVRCRRSARVEFSIDLISDSRALSRGRAALDDRVEGQRDDQGRVARRHSAPQLPVRVAENVGIKGPRASSASATARLPRHGRQRASAVASARRGGGCYADIPCWRWRAEPRAAPRLLPPRHDHALSHAGDPRNATGIRSGRGRLGPAHAAAV